jgi:catechol 2,3-dioxygenase-like lactoylglutathione lyase family enzyme
VVPVPVSEALGGARNEGFDHITVVVDDLEEARRFFGLLGFVERVAVVVSGAEMGRYMGIADWEADHVTLELEGSPNPVQVHQEVQLLRFHRPEAVKDAGAGSLDRTGFNHVCFRVSDLDAMLAHLEANGVVPRNEVMDFHDRRLVFLDGPGVVVELAEWVTA